MKMFLILFFSSFMCVFSYGQKRTCASLHTGIFELQDSVYGNTIITRNQNTQTESNKKKGTTIIFNIKWLDSCTYQLKVKKVIKDNENLSGQQGDILTNRIIEINDSSYIVRTTANFTTMTLDSKIKIIK